jgi:c-di-GMP-binding flagellar brake protein YcgR
MYDAPLIKQLLNRLSVFLGFAVSLELVLAALATVLGVGFLVAFLQKRSISRRHAQQRKRIVRELLNSAIDQRSTLELAFTSEDMHGRVLSGPCTSISDDSATVDIGIEHRLESWIGETVDVSFQLPYKDTSAYYHFPSRVIGWRDRPLMISVELALPSQILPMQKRTYMRINPLPGHILGMGLWSLDPTQPLPPHSTSLGCASLSYRPGKLTQCSLLNLSAGGMRIEVPQALLQQFPLSLTLQSQMLCLLLLRSPDSDQPMPFWLACTVVGLIENQEDANVVIGLKFRAWSLSETGNSNIVWFPAGKSGEVSPLASWVLRQQLEQNKRRE